METIADRIIKQLENQKITYAELEKRTGIPKSALQRYATNTTSNIPINRLELISKALNVSTSYLLGWEEVETSKPKKQKLRSIARLEDNEQITPEQDKQITRFIEYLLQEEKEEE